MSWLISRSSGRRLASRLRPKVLLLATALLAGSLSGATGADEPCNPIIDGTYCATNMPKNRGTVRSSSSMKALDDYSRFVPSAAVSGPPGTLIGIGTQGNSTCFGLLRRSTCD